MLYLLEWSIDWFKVDISVYRKTLNVIVVALATGLFFTLAELHEVFWYTSEPLKREQYLATLLGGNSLLTTLMWLWISLGTAATILGIIPSVRASKAGIAFISLVTFVAVFSEKTLATILPGFIVNPLGLKSEYHITPIEVFVSIGIHATVLILFAILIRAYVASLRGREVSS